jgi:probable phosphoglycerate mutase
MSTVTRCISSPRRHHQRRGSPRLGGRRHLDEDAGRQNGWRSAADDKVAAVYCSPLRLLRRHRRLRRRPHGLTPIVRPPARIAHGRWGPAPRQVEAQFAEEYAWEADPFTFAPEGGGSGLHVLA